MNENEQSRRSRRWLLGLLLLPLVLGGGQASCSFMSGDQEDEHEDKKHKEEPSAQPST